MKFYARERELEILETQYKQVRNTSIMTVITGRRRIGKTSLSKLYSKGKKTLYLFVSKKDEVLLCEEFTQAIKEKFDIPIYGNVRRFKDVFKIIMDIGQNEKIIVILDEFQEFFQINRSVYSDVQNVWDQYKNTSNIHLICIGSVYSLMTKIFKDSKEPLFGRADRVMYLKPFPPHVIKEILEDENRYSNENLFINYLLTGGVPRYQEILLANKKFSEEEILRFYFKVDSPFIEEGRTILIEEFGKEYGTYFSILELLSEGRTSRSEIGSILEKDIGGYLEKLVTDYNIVGKIKPIGAKPTGRIQKYCISDNFLKFWFRYVYKYRTAIENNNYEYIRNKLKETLKSYSGPILEKLYQEIYRNSGKYMEIGNYWEKGNQNEIDIVCIDELNKRIKIAEVKLNKDKINITELKEKSQNLIKNYKEYEKEYIGLGLQDIDHVVKNEGL
ncbi:ATP-binding protein [Sediminispirochaeta smaragdinae]|uniref:ATPase n=1 Tax=Sediminispirochaeta smaragdinae (strain DSM 11293 / JCM 15392 / SEBR 4228) TaxID=573413 RepID=E1RBY1_SEDSS|nr:ATP-binding protein [Sediminispirochaeta smaragdinae]ADK79861.1 ATPase [Sediminispirochaeta smaragdinae DSM 11293]